MHRILFPLFSSLFLFGFGCGEPDGAVDDEDKQDLLGNLKEGELCNGSDWRCAADLGLICRPNADIIDVCQLPGELKQDCSVDEDCIEGLGCHNLYSRLVCWPGEKTACGDNDDCLPCEDDDVCQGDKVCRPLASEVYEVLRDYRCVALGTTSSVCEEDEDCSEGLLCRWVKLFAPDLAGHQKVLNPGSCLPGTEISCSKDADCAGQTGPVCRPSSDFIYSPEMRCQTIGGLSDLCAVDDDCQEGMICDGADVQGEIVYSIGRCQMAS